MGKYVTFYSTVVADNCLKMKVQQLEVSVFYYQKESCVYISNERGNRIRPIKL